MNGINGGGGGVPAGVVGFGGPIPAGHQAELNYIYGMVEELSRQLTENRRVTEEIVSGLGRVRNRARVQGQGNEDIIGTAAEDILCECTPLLSFPSTSTNCLGGDMVCPHMTVR
jgi:hypothetical protein